MSPKRIRIFQAPNSRVCVVELAKLQPGDHVVWVNDTGADAIVFFPHAGALGPASFHHQVGTGAHNTSPPCGPATRRGPSGPEEQYSYAVYCFATNRFAVGGSDPEIIIV